MDLYKAIQNLYAEKEKLEHVIASLEELQRNSGAVPDLPGGKRRGRKSMSSKERKEGGFGALEKILGRPARRRPRQNRQQSLREFVLNPGPRGRLGLRGSKPAVSDRST
jgi:hypothetical protein